MLRRCSALGSSRLSGPGVAGAGAGLADALGRGAASTSAMSGSPRRPGEALHCPSATCRGAPDTLWVNTLSWLFRDWRDHDQGLKIDVRLFDLLATVQTILSLVAGPRRRDRRSIRAIARPSATARSRGGGQLAAHPRPRRRHRHRRHRAAPGRRRRRDRRRAGARPLCRFHPCRRRPAGAALDRLNGAGRAVRPVVRGFPGPAASRVRRFGAACAQQPLELPSDRLAIAIVEGSQPEGREDFESGLDLLGGDAPSPCPGRVAPDSLDARRRGYPARPENLRRVYRAAARAAEERVERADCAYRIRQHVFVQKEMDFCGSMIRRAT